MAAEGEEVKLFGKNRAWYKKKLIKHILPIGFAAALCFALAWPWPGKELSEIKVDSFRVIQTINVITIFIISGLTLKTDDIKKALGAYLSLGYGLAAILVITPMMGFAAVNLPFSPKDFAIGLAIFCCVPTTLTSGVTLVGQAYGNAALALMLTVCSNLLGIASVPFLLDAILQSGADVKLDAVKLLIKLICTILVPLVIGKALQEASEKVRGLVKANKTVLSLTNSLSLICIVWQTLSRSRDKLLDTKFANIVLIIVAGVILHVVFLAINFVGVSVFRLDPAEMKAVWLMSSQKTLPVAVTIISNIGDDLGDTGLITIPCIVGHMSQLFIDAVIVSRMAAKHEAHKAAAAEAEAALENGKASADGNFTEMSKLTAGGAAGGEEDGSIQVGKENGH